MSVLVGIKSRALVRERLERSLTSCGGNGRSMLAGDQGDAPRVAMKEISIAVTRRAPI